MLFQRCGAIAIAMATVVIAASPPVSGSVLIASTSAAVRLTATYLVPPTQLGLSIPTQVLKDLGDTYIGGTYGAPPEPVSIVDYPASAINWDNSVATGVANLQHAVAGDPEPVMFGYSQGAVVISDYKRLFNEQYADAAPGAIPHPTFVVIGTGSRPNGGMLTRLRGLHIPILNLTADTLAPTETAGAAPDQTTTYDIARQYDLAADFPKYPLNLLATANAVLGLLYSHGDYSSVDLKDAVLQDHYGDTNFYLIPMHRLPLLMPLEQPIPPLVFSYLGLPQLPQLEFLDPLVAVLDAPLRVLVEAGYDRTVSPGVLDTAGVIPSVDPRQLATNFTRAIPTGLDDGLQELGLGRPFGTTLAGPYGVGGPPVTLPGNELVSGDIPDVTTLDAVTEKVRSTESQSSTDKLAENSAAVTPAGPEMKLLTAADGALPKLSDLAGRLTNQKQQSGPDTAGLAKTDTNGAEPKSTSIDPGQTERTASKRPTNSADRGDGNQRHSRKMHRQSTEREASGATMGPGIRSRSASGNSSDGSSTVGGSNDHGLRSTKVAR